MLSTSNCQDLLTYNKYVRGFIVLCFVTSVSLTAPAEQQAGQPPRLHLHDRRVLHQHQERSGQTGV